ncbi:hypothetical protein BLNAU_23487 [Blattamonas nauphoetae]|uniref:Uncharacterized protein n=1 Tax=Blattamonas nauphoetae TaxID=2049346 RepID=A0ABQ9WQ55_9EUKA|nr:hypothetical protein BLNAU_23487 [Blattamonas nauphoetae]
MNEAGTPRLAIVSSSMLSISESVLELSPSTSPILVCSSTMEESPTESSVVVQKCSISSESGQLRGVVETSAFPDIGESVSVSIVGCSLDSSRILGKDGIGLSLTRTPRKGEKVIGRITSSLIGSSFVNMSSIGSSHQPRLPHLNQKMLGCVVSLSSGHLSGSTIRDVNTVGCVLCSNSSFSSLLSSPNPDPNTEPWYLLLPHGEYTPDDFESGKPLWFQWDCGDENSSVDQVFVSSHFESFHSIAVFPHLRVFHTTTLLFVFISHPSFDLLLSSFTLTRSLEPLPLSQTLPISPLTLHVVTSHLAFPQQLRFSLSRCACPPTVAREELKLSSNLESLLGLFCVLVWIRMNLHFLISYHITSLISWTDSIVSRFILFFEQLL